MKSISIFGSYNRNSIGDKAILISLLHLLCQESDPDLQFNIIVHDVAAIQEELHGYGWYERVHVMPLTSRAQPATQSPASEDTSGRRKPNRLTYPVLTGLSIARSSLQIHRDFADKSIGLIVGGGNLIMDFFPTWPVRLELLTGQFARKRLPIAFVGVGAFPIGTRAGNFLLSRSVRRADPVYVRDDVTARHIEEEWHVPAHSRPDLAFSFPCADGEPRPDSTQQPTVVVNIGPLFAGSKPLADPQSQQIFVNELALVLNRYWMQCEGKPTFLLLDTNYPTDRSLSLALQDQLVALGIGTSAIRYNDRLLTCEETLQELRSASFAITTRLHAGILALRSGLPIIAIAYQPKVTDVFSSLGLEHAVIPVDQISSELADRIESLSIDPRPFCLSRQQLEEKNAENQDVIRHILSTMTTDGAE